MQTIDVTVVIGERRRTTHRVAKTLNVTCAKGLKALERSKTPNEEVTGLGRNRSNDER